MTAPRHTTLPQMDGRTFLTDAGIETYIMYKKGHDLPYFSLYHLLNDETATADIRDYIRALIAVALRHRTGMILCGLHYRASRDWGKLLGYSRQSLADINRKGVDLLRALAEQHETPESPMVVSACVGPRGDAYQLNKTITEAEAEDYHAEQIGTLHAAGADMVSALTFNNIPEAIGFSRAAAAVGIPSVMSFTLDDTGRLKTGHTLGQAIEAVDEATDGAPAYYMINCTHPDDFAPALSSGDWTARLRGIRPNASSLAKGILCKLGHLEEGDPDLLGRQLADIARRFPRINVWGGCCGTDHVHMEEICRNVLRVRDAA